MFRTPDRCCLRIHLLLVVLACCVLSVGTTPVSAQCTASCLSGAIFPLSNDQTVATVSSAMPGGFNQHVVIVVDSIDPPTNAPGTGQNWFTSLFSNQISPTTPADEWNVANLGEVFGIALDQDTPPNIWVTATTVYNIQNFGSGGAGAVYKLDGVTGDICVAATLPNTGPALGNICYDSRNDQFFVSNMEDGLIYRLPGLDCGGAAANTYDHGVDGRNAGGVAPPIPDSGTAGFTQLGRRVWAVQVHPSEYRLYYSVWWEDGARQETDPQRTNEVWSVALDPVTGDFLPATAVREIQMPALPSQVYSSPIPDISFSPSCDMVVAERSKYADIGGDGAHASRVLQFTGGTGSWAPSAPCSFLPMGNYAGSFPAGYNSAGGVAHDCDGNIWGTADAISFVPCNSGTGTGGYIYGLQRVDAAGNCTDSTPIVNSYLIDLDCDILGVDKTWLGDVEHVHNDCATGCVSCNVEDGEILCNADGTFSYSATVTNNTGITAEHIKLIPIGSFTMAPDTFNVTIPDGGSFTFNVTISGASPGDAICFEIWLLDDNFEQCCVNEHCVRLPDCCFDLINTSVDCIAGSGGDFTFTFTLVNEAPYPIDRIFLWPTAPVTMDPNEFILGTPIPTGGSTLPLKVVISGAIPGSTISFDISIHDSTTGDCCGSKVELALPDCNPCDIPDDCHVTEFSEFCFVQGSDILEAFITLTICNNCPGAAVQYQVDFNGITDNCCPNPILTAADFSPNGFLTPPIAPGECLDIPITVNSIFGIINLGEIACFSVAILNTSTGNVLECGGKILLPDMIKVGGDPAGGVLVIEYLTGADVMFQVTNQDVQTLTLDYELSPLLHGDPPLTPLSLDGLPPGEPVIGSVLLPAGTSTVVSVLVSFDTHDPLGYHSVFLKADLDGNGLTDPLASQSVKSVISVDCNMNGVPDDVDIIIGNSTDADGDGIPDECGGPGPLQPEFLRGDSNDDGTFDLADPIHVLDFLFAGGEGPPCADAADADDSGALDLVDAIRMAGALFGGVPLEEPYPSCGRDESFDTLGCMDTSCP